MVEEPPVSSSSLWHRAEDVSFMLGSVTCTRQQCLRVVFSNPQYCRAGSKGWAVSREASWVTPRDLLLGTVLEVEGLGDVGVDETQGRGGLAGQSELYCSWKGEQVTGLYNTLAPRFP